MHPTPRQFLFDNAAVILPALALLWLALKTWFAPDPIPDPVECPFCKGTGTKTIHRGSPCEGEVHCAYCHGVGKLASFETRKQVVTGPCRACDGKATVITLDGLKYPDGTLLPGTTARQVPCTASDCENGWQKPHTQPVFGNLVALSSSQFADELAARRAAAKAAQEAAIAASTTNNAN